MPIPASGGGDLLGIVGSNITTAFTNALAAFSTGESSLQALTGAVDSLTIPAIDVGSASSLTPPAAPSAASPPAVPTVTIPRVSVSGVPALEIDFDTLPTGVTNTTVKPPISIPPPPTFLFPDAPVEPSVEIDVTLPSVPDYTIPQVPAFIDISIPEAPSIVIDTFDETAPDVHTLVAPDLTAYEILDREDDITACVDTLIASLCDISANGGNLINTQVETNMWARDFDREEQLSQKAQAEVATDMASKGFGLPNGVLLARLTQARQDGQDKQHTAVRELAIKRADLEQDTFKFVVGQIKDFEQMKYDQWLGITNLSLEQYKYTNQLALDLYNTNVQRVQLEFELYKTAAQVYEVIVKSELAKVEVYRAELEGQKILGELNLQEIQLYSAQIEAVGTIMELYKTELEGVKVELDVEQTKVSIYKTQVDAYTATFSAAQTEADVFKTLLSGELAKVQIYEADVRAYSTEIQAYATEVDAITSKGKLQIAQQESQINAYTANIRAAEVQAQVSALTTRATIDLFMAQKEIYVATESTQTSHYLAMVEVYKADIARINSEGALALQAQIGAAEVTMKGQEAVIGGIAGTAQAAAQLATAAMSAININAGLSGSDNYSVQHIATYEGGSAQ